MRGCWYGTAFGGELHNPLLHKDSAVCFVGGSMEDVQEVADFCALLAAISSMFKRWPLAL
jgi:hypothetical protein